MNIGIDIGGSHIGIALVEDGNIVGNVKEKDLTRKERLDLKQTLIDDIIRMVNELLSENKISIQSINTIGISSPRNCNQRHNSQSRKLRLLQL